MANAVASELLFDDGPVSDDDLEDHQAPRDFAEPHPGHRLGRKHANSEATPLDLLQPASPRPTSTAPPATCPICLQPFEDRSSLVGCGHEFCHECLLRWGEVSRACPMCKRAFDECLHRFTTDDDFYRYKFPPLAAARSKFPASEPPRRGIGGWTNGVARGAGRRPRAPRRDVAAELERARRRYTGENDEDRRRRLWVEGRVLDGEFEEMDGEERRRFVYHHRLFARHVGAGRSGYSTTVTLERFRRDQPLRARLLPWLRRELRVLLRDVDAELVKDLTMAVMERFDLQSDAAAGLLRPFFQERTEQFVHECTAFLRSPFEMDVWDRVV
ncbi:hypothetical protein HK101_002370, partial [Irineochytrium annulatum]